MSKGATIHNHVSNNQFLAADSQLREEWSIGKYDKDVIQVVTAAKKAIKRPRHVIPIAKTPVVRKSSGTNPYEGARTS